MNFAGIAAFLRRTLNEVPLVASIVTGALSAVLLAVEALPPETSLVGFGSAVVLALVRFFVSPAFPQGSQKAIDQAHRFDILALRQLAAEGDAVAAEVLRVLDPATPDSTGD